MKVQLTDEQIAEVQAGLGEPPFTIALTTEQLAIIKSMLAYEHSGQVAARTYAPVVNELAPVESWDVELFHSGGNIWLVEIQDKDTPPLAPEDGDDEARRPYVWISDETADEGTWGVGRYLRYGDEGTYFDGIPTGQLVDVVKTQLEILKQEAFKERDLLTPEGWLAHNDIDLRASVMGNGRTSPPPPPGWEVTVMVHVDGGVHTVEYGGNRHWNSYGPMVVMFDNHTEQRFALWWTDFVANDWTEWFISYDRALDRFAHLFLAVAHDITFGEMEPITTVLVEGGIEDMAQHFARKHPTGEEGTGERPVRVWWDIPHTSRGSWVYIEDDGDPRWVLQPYYSGSQSGEGVGENTYYCGICEQRLDLGDSEIREDV